MVGAYPPATHPPSATYDPRASSLPTYFDKFTPMVLYRGGLAVAGIASAGATKCRGLAARRIDLGPTYTVQYQSFHIR